MSSKPIDTALRELQQLFRMPVSSYKQYNVCSSTVLCIIQTIFSVKMCVIMLEYSCAQNI